MNIKRILCTVYIGLSVTSFASNAALIDRGGGLIYDTDQNITWLQNANLFGEVINRAVAAHYWAENLIYHDSVRNTDWDDWRLPKSDFSCTEIICSTSEMGHLYHIDGITYLTPGPFVNLQGGYWEQLTTPPPEGIEATSFSFIDGTRALPLQTYPLHALAVRDGDVVPIPAAAWLFSSGLIGLIGIARRKKT